jgi:hypothetical protein
VSNGWDPSTRSSAPPSARPAGGCVPGASARDAVLSVCGHGSLGINHTCIDGGIKATQSSAAEELHDIVWRPHRAATPKQHPKEGIGPNWSVRLLAAAAWRWPRGVAAAWCWPGSRDRQRSHRHRSSCAAAAPVPRPPLSRRAWTGRRAASPPMVLPSMSSRPFLWWSCPSLCERRCLGRKRKVLKWSTKCEAWSSSCG